jgi:hypothetical protein
MIFGRSIVGEALKGVGPDIGRPKIIGDEIPDIIGSIIEKPFQAQGSNCRGLQIPKVGGGHKGLFFEQLFNGVFLALHIIPNEQGRGVNN